MWRSIIPDADNGDDDGDDDDDDFLSALVHYVFLL
jgi:hypothetical protein